MSAHRPNDGAFPYTSGTVYANAVQGAQNYSYSALSGTGTVGL